MTQPHTPAPWSYGKYKTHDYYVGAQYVEGNTEYEGHIAICPVEANARLIAAAPETAVERDNLKKQNEQLIRSLRKIQGKIIDIASIKDGALGYELNQLQKSIDVEIAKAEGK